MQRQAVKTKPLTREETTRVLGAHEAELRARGVTRLAVFGSTARNEARPDSDVDLLVDIDWRRKFSIFDWAGFIHPGSAVTLLGCDARYIDQQRP